MSAGVDQRNKGQSNQVSNGPKEQQMKDAAFDNYFDPTQGGYGTATMSSSSVADAAYMPSYYPSMSFQYLNQPGINDGAWSNGGDPMSFLGGYGQVDNSYMPGGAGMFSGIYQQPAGFDWGFSGGGDYSAWVNPTAQQQQPGHKDDRGYSDGYGYRMPHPDAAYMNGGEMDRDIKVIEQNFKSMSFQDHKVDSGKDHAHMGHTSSTSSAPPPKKTWASIASQPARPTSNKPKSIPRAPLPANKHMDIGTWDSNKGPSQRQGSSGAQSRQGQAWTGSQRSGRSANGGSGNMSSYIATPSGSGVPSNGGGNSNGAVSIVSNPVLDKLRSANQYNPKDFNMNPKGARYFIIKSYSEDDIHRSIKYSIWCSTEHGNKRLDSAYKERESKGPLYLFFSVNGSGHFCGMAQMMSALDYSAVSSVWAQDKWKGQFEVKWIYVKDVPNSQLRHIRLENNENKPVTNSRDTQEVPPEKGKQVLKIIHNYRHLTSIFDDFSHYEKRQEEDTEETPTKSQEYRGSTRNNTSRAYNGNN